VPPSAGAGAGGGGGGGRPNAQVISCVDFDCEEGLLATAGVSQRVALYSVAAARAGGGGAGPAGRPARELLTRSRLSCISFGAARRAELLASDYEGGLCLWDVEAGACVREDLDAHTGRIWSVHCCPAQPGRFASGGDDGKLKARAGGAACCCMCRGRCAAACRAVWRRPPPPPSSPCALAASALSERRPHPPPLPRAQVWDAAAGPGSAAPALSLDLKSSVCCAQFSPGLPHLLAAGTAAHRGLVFDLRSPREPLYVLSGHRKAVSYVRWLREEECVTASTDSSLRVWDASPGGGGRCTHALRGHANERNFVGLATDGGAYVACGSESNELFLYARGVGAPLLRAPLARPDTPPGPHFVSAVAWGRASGTLAAANSLGSTWLFSLTPL
jgi:hypothetical protein